jgi:hypothetical protein
MQTEKPAETPMTEPTLSPRRNVTAFVYGAGLVVVLLLGLPCFAVAVVVPDQSLSNPAVGAGLALTALGMAGLGLSSAALYRHPAWKLPALFAVFPGWFGLTQQEYTHGERTFVVAWLGIVSAVTAAAAAFVVFARSAISAPPAFWLTEAALYTIAVIPGSVVKLRALWRHPKARS